MKKFLVILMVLAMASVLFVGCTTPPTPTPTPTPTPDPATVSATPVLTAVETAAGAAIFDVTSTAVLYMNAEEAGSSILVRGTAPAESVVKIYVDDVALISVAETAVTGLWTIAIAESSLGADGVKVMHATVTEVGLAESAVSNAVTFTLDTVLPSATALAATAEAAAGLASGTATLNTNGTAIATATATAASVVTGTWTIDVLGASGDLNNVQITEPDGTINTYTGVLDDATFAAFAPVPGVALNFVDTLAAGQQSTLVCLAETALITDRARVYFSEEITNTSAILAANYTWTVGGAARTVDSVSYSDRYMYFSNFSVALAQGDALGVSVNGVADLAGNIQTTASVLTYTVAAPHATTLAP